jgi:hypothetical protein
MKTHAVKENRILKSFDLVLIVLTMSFVTYTILGSPNLFPGLSRHSGLSESRKAEFPIMHQESTSGVFAKSALETTVIKADRQESAINKEKQANAEIKSGTIKRNQATSIKGRMQLEAVKVDQSLGIATAAEVTENANVADTHHEKSALEQWIISRDSWEQK